jgi:hypothetical protein
VAPEETEMSYFHALREKHDAELAAEAKAARRQPKPAKVFEVRDEQGRVVGRCASKAKAVEFIRDSLSSTGWSIKA